ncbi:MAG: hypothetical protein U0872_07075 [Planctomycetaceae bacterium]
MSFNSFDLRFDYGNAAKLSTIRGFAVPSLTSPDPIGTDKFGSDNV